MRGLILTALLLAPATARAQDIEAGKTVFQTCAACHEAGENAKTKIGPPLNGLFGSKAAAQPGFTYSSALRNSGIVWDAQTFGQFIAYPRGLVAGTSMTFAGIADRARIANLAAYLAQFDASGKIMKPAPLPQSAQAPKPAEAAPPQNANTECLRSLGAAEGQQACAGVGGELLQAIGTLLAPLPSSGFGNFDGTGLIDKNDSGSDRYFETLTQSASDPCVAESFHLSQQRINVWAQALFSAYDFHKITRVRYIIKPDDLSTGASAKANDPSVQQVALEGQDWICSRMISLDPARGAQGPSCEPLFAANAVGPENRTIILRALDVVRKACGLPE